MQKKIIVGILLVFGLQSCIDLVDDLTIREDGTGFLNYSVNLSASKAKVNSVLALDSLNGKPVPSKEQIQEKIALFKQKLTQQDGITNLKIEEDYTNYLFKFYCEFQNVGKFQEAIIKTIDEVAKQSPSQQTKQQNWIVENEHVLIRHIPPSVVEQIKKLTRDDSEALQQGTYTSITRFDKKVVNFENKIAKLSKNQKAILLQTDVYSLLQNPKLLDNKIEIEN